MAMENFLRKIEKRDKEKAAEAAHQAKTPEQFQKEEQEQAERAARPSIPEMMQDPELSQQFGGFLKAHADPATRSMGERMLAGNLEAGDVVGLEGKRDELFEQKKQSERLSEALQGERFEQMLGSSPKLQSLCDAYGKDNIQEILRDGARYLMYLDQKGFKELYGVLETIEGFEKTVEQPLQEKLSAFCKKFTIKEDAVVQAMESDDPRERRRQLEGAIRKGMSGWGAKLPAWLPAQWAGQVVGWGEKAKDRARTPQQQYSEYGRKAVAFARNHDTWKDAIEMRQETLETQGDFMASFVSQNKEVRQALGRVINGELPYFKEVLETTATYEEARGMLLNEKNAKKLVDTYKSANKAIDFKTLAPADFDTQMGKVYDQAQKQAQTESGKREGFWASIIDSIFAAAQQRNDFIKDPAMRSMLAGA